MEIIVSSSHELLVFGFAVGVLSRVRRAEVLSSLDRIRGEEVLDNVVACADVWCQFEGLEVHEALCLNEVEVLSRVEVLLVWLFREQEVVVWSVVLVVIVLRDPFVDRVFLL